MKYCVTNPMIEEANKALPRVLIVDPAAPCPHSALLCLVNVLVFQDVSQAFENLS